MEEEIKINYSSWDDLKDDEEQKNIHKESARFIAEVNLLESKYVSFWNKKDIKKEIIGGMTMMILSFLFVTFMVLLIVWANYLFNILMF